jgi:hypothetical protein
VAGQPVAQLQKPIDRGWELRDVLLTPALGGHAHARGHVRLVDIERSGALDDRLHRSSFDRR